MAIDYGQWAIWLGLGIVLMLGLFYYELWDVAEGCRVLRLIFEVDVSKEKGAIVKDQHILDISNFSSHLKDLS